MDIDIPITSISVNGDTLTPTEGKIDIEIPKPTVFQATDTSKSGGADPETLTPYDPNKSPQVGDFLIVKHVLTKKTVDGQEVDDAVEYTAYMRKKVNTVDTWLACSGKMDASKVVLTKDITMAGNYENIGNFTKGGTAGINKNFLQDGKSTKGVTVYELIKQMLSKTLEPAINTTPSVSLSVTNETYTVEIGTTVNPTFSLSYTDGNYKYQGGSEQAAGCAKGTPTITGAT